MYRLLTTWLVFLRRLFGCSLRVILLINLCLTSSQVLASDDVDGQIKRAITAGDMQALALLIPQTDTPDITNNQGKTALMMAAKSANTTLLDQLLYRGASANARNNNGGTPLMYGAISGDVTILQRLLAAGADINATGSNGWSALMIAVAKGHNMASELLIARGADINAQDVYLWSALHRAAYAGRDTLVAFLLEQASTKINLEDDHGATALHHAAAQGHWAICELLIAHGVDVSHKDINALLASDYARKNGHDALALLLHQRAVNDVLE